MPSIFFQTVRRVVWFLFGEREEPPPLLPRLPFSLQFLSFPFDALRSSRFYEKALLFQSSPSPSLRFKKKPFLKPLLFFSPPPPPNPNPNFPPSLRRSARISLLQRLSGELVFESRVFADNLLVFWGSAIEVVFLLLKLSFYCFFSFSFRVL